MSRLHSISLFTLIAIMLVACGGQPDIPTPDPTEALKTVAGEYFLQITQEDLDRSGLTDPALAGAVGLWEFTFTDDGKIRGYRNGVEAGYAVYGFNGSEMNVMVDRCEDCGCEKSISRFTWAVDDEQLVLRTTYDGCESMNFILTSKPLARR